MAETMNYRMNLVIDPKNVIKANRELRAMERYFERIQGRVLRIGRTRMAPEIVLKDRASKGLDNLLRKLQRVRSEVVNASGTVNLNIKQASGQTDFSLVVQALQGNTIALQDLTKALGALQIGGVAPAAPEAPEKPRTFWDKTKDGFGAIKTFGGGVKSAAEIPGKGKAVKDAWKGIVNGVQQSMPRRQRMLNTTKALGDLVSTFGSAGADLIGGTQGLWKSGKELVGGGSGIASKAISFVGSAASEIGKGNLGAMASGLIKGGLKKLPGPLGLVGDVMSIASAKPGKERSQAIGSAAGGTIGSVVGGALGTLIPIPGVGTAVGSMVGGAVGDFVGGKIGGFIADSAPKIKEAYDGVTSWFSKNILGKKDKPKDKEDVAKKPDVITAPYNPEKKPDVITAPYNPEKKPVLQNAPYNPYNPPSVRTAPLIQNRTLPPYPPSSPYYQSYQMGMGMTSPQNMNMAGPGPRMQSAVTNNATSAGGKMPQVVQISPEQLTTLSGFLRDMKTETTTQYNLPPGAVQVTVHEEYPVDVEGIIQQVGQRLRAEFAKATQNRKPQSMALA